MTNSTTTQGVDRDRGGIPGLNKTAPDAHHKAAIGGRSASADDPTDALRNAQSVEEIAAARRRAAEAGTNAAAPAPESKTAPDPSAPETPAASASRENQRVKTMFDDPHFQTMVALEAGNQTAEIRQDFETRLAEYEQKLKMATDAASEANDAVAAADRRAEEAFADTEKLQKMYASLAVGQRIAPSGQNHTPTGLGINTGEGDRGNWHVDGMVREFKGLFDKAERSSATDRTTGQSYTQIDRSDMVAFLKTVDRDALRRGMERDMARNGFLTGGAKQRNMTAPSDVAPIYLEFLADEMRRTHAPTRIFWQFPKLFSRPDAMAGASIRVPRKQRRPTPKTASEWELTYRGVVSQSVQPIELSSVLIPIKAWGMGGGGSAATDPISISELVLAASLSELLATIYDGIGDNYRDWEDTIVREIMFSSSRKLYSNGDGDIVQSSAEVVSNGKFTYDLLINLGTQLSSESVEPLRDGKFGLWLSPLQLGQLSIDIQEKRAPRNKVDVRDLSEILAPPTGATYGNDARVDGYVGSFGSFHIFSSNTVGVGTPENDIAVQSETTGGGATLTHAGLAFGADAVSRVNVSEMEIVEDDWHRFNSVRSFAWKEVAGVAGSDVNGDRTPVVRTEGTTDRSSEQTRVFRVHTTVSAVA